MNDRYLIWLEWPEACFRADAVALAWLAGRVRGEVVRARDESEFLRELPTATHVATWRFDSGWFALAPRLRVLATPAAGREFVPSAGPAGVRIHFGGFHGRIIAETVAAFMSAWVRGFFLCGAIRRGARVPGLADGESAWPRTFLSDKCRGLAGTRALIAGYGRIGRAIGERLAGMGVSVEGFTRRNVADLPRAAADADWLVMALPSDTGTDGFLSAELIACLPPRAVVVNVGRGNAVDEAALLAALRSGRLAGAYLDVFRGETNMRRGGEGSGEAAGMILSTPPGELPWNLVAMPHSAAFSPEYVTDFFKELIDEGLF